MTEHSECERIRVKGATAFREMLWRMLHIIFSRRERGKRETIEGINWRGLVAWRCREGRIALCEMCFI